MTALIVVTFGTLAVSALCSLFEAVLYSTRIVTVEATRTEDPGEQNRADRMIRLKESIGDPIAAILILNTIANTAGCTVAGVLAAKIYGPTGVLVFSGGLVVGILFLSEIIPKTVGAVYWRRLWSMIVWPLVVLKWLLHPIIWIVQRLTGLITRDADIVTATEDEILAMVSRGAQEGQLSAEEGEMVRNIINLENQLAKDILTPRVVMFTLDAETSATGARDVVRSVGFSRIPVYKEHPENVTGYILRRDLHAAAAEDGSQSIQGIAKTISFVPETANCLTLLNQFLKHRWHIAMVMDEYGGLAGMITLEDLIETLLGSEIVDETDRHIDMQEAAQNWKQAHSDPAPADPPPNPPPHA